MSETIDLAARRKAKEDKNKSELRAEAQDGMVSITVCIPPLFDTSALVGPDEAERLGQMLLAAAAKARVPT